MCACVRAFGIHDGQGVSAGIVLRMYIPLVWGGWAGGGLRCARGRFQSSPVWSGRKAGRQAGRQAAAVMVVVVVMVILWLRVSSWDKVASVLTLNEFESLAYELAHVPL